MPTTPIQASSTAVKSLLIVGASARAAAQAAQRVFEEIFTIDLFADSDTKAVANAYRVDDLVSAGKLADSIKADVWMFTGGMENRPDLVKFISGQIPLAGNAAENLRPLLDSRCFFRTLENEGVPFPAVFDLDSFQADQMIKYGPDRFLIKELNSTGGQGVQTIQTDQDLHRFRKRKQKNSTSYVQKFVEGQNLSAVFVSSAEGVKEIGISHQLCGDPHFGATGFGYCGSIEVRNVDDKVLQRIRSMATTLATAFGLRGLFGIDVIVDDEAAWLVDLNPRFPASCELFVDQHPDLISSHLSACGFSVGRQSLELGKQHASRNNQSMRGKAILFNRLDHEIFLDAKIEKLIPHWDCQVADIPNLPIKIQPGHPVLTILVEAISEHEVRNQLKLAASRIKKELGLDPE